MSYHIQHLAAADLPLMRGLLQMFALAFDDPEHYADHPPRAAYLERLLGTPTFIALVARKGDAVVGGIAAYELQKFEQERSEIYLYDLAVLDGHRREGIATALIESLRGIAAARGASVVFVQADTGPDDEAAIALYSRLGSREEVLHFDIAVRPADGAPRR